jgi:hypothetical protein
MQLWTARLIFDGITSYVQWAGAAEMPVDHKVVAGDPRVPRLGRPNRRSRIRRRRPIRYRSDSPAA